MRRPLVLLVAVALAGTGAALPSSASAAPPESAPGASQAPAAVPDELLVGYVEGAAPEAKQRARGRAQAVLSERVVRAAQGRREVELVRLPAGRDRAAAIAALEADPVVAYAEPNWVYTTQATSNDPYYTNGSLWGMAGSNPYGSQAAKAWLAGHTGSGDVYVGVIDEGIQYNHPDLVGNVGNPREMTGRSGVDDDGNGFVDDLHGWDFVGNDNTVYDGGRAGKADKHGTHVAGTIGARGGNGVGVAGVSWRIGMISGKFLGRNGGTTANAIKAVDYFTQLREKGVKVVATNNSWGGGGYSRGLQDAISRANDANILFIAAAGNDGQDNDDPVDYPSGYDLPNVVAVAAIDSTGALAAFSNYGATSVDLGAPGVGIYSTLPNNSYGAYNGTSMATPHVSGAAALYASVKTAPTAAQIKDALLSSAVPTASLNGRTATGGRLDANAALSR